MALVSATSAATINSFWNNRAGLKHLNDKAYYPAYQDFMRALSDDPLNLSVQMNLGLTFLQNEDFPKAEQAFRGAAELAGENTEARFAALFNLALAQTQQQKLDDALNSYQACLELRPDSLEVKTNIELLWQGGGGGGKGKNQKDKKDPKDDKMSNQEKREKGDIQNQPQKKEPKPFQSQDLSKEDVKRILDEIKNQEQGIRAQEYDKSAKEAPRGKDW